MKRHIPYSLFLAILALAIYSALPKTPRYTGRKDKQDEIEKAWAWEAFLTKDPSVGRVPAERLLEVMRVKNERLQKLKQMKAVQGISWSERGPNNVGGRTRALMFDLNDAGNGYKKVWAGAVSGGLWYTNDITATNVVWNKVNDLFENLAISAIVQNPLNNQELYFSTGEGLGNIDAVRGMGIWKSSDGGSTWARLSSTSGFLYVNDLAFDSYGNLLAAVSNNGIQRSSNGGSTWTRVLGSTSLTGRDIEIAADGDIYATMSTSTTGGIYRSQKSLHNTNTGTSGTWQDITPDANGTITTINGSWRRIELANAPSNGNIVYALFAGIVNNSNTCSSIQRFDKATGLWTVKASSSSATSPIPKIIDQGANSPFTRGQAWYDLIAVVDPANENTVYIGGIDALRSNDGGTTWTQMTTWAMYAAVGFTTAQHVHADHHMYVYAPGSSSRLLMGTDGGVYYTTNANVAVGKPTFVEKNTGYNVTQFYAGAISPTQTNYFLAGSQDNGTQKFTAAGLVNTTEATGGDGGFCHIDKDNHNIQITSYVYNQYHISTNGGQSFSSRNFNTNGGFINPTDYDDIGNKLYAGNTTGTFLRWNDPATAGSSYDIVTVAEFNSASITCVKASPNTANRIYFGLSNGSVVMVDNAHTGTTLTGTIIKPAVANTSISWVEVAGNDDNRMLITSYNYGINNIYLSSNALAATPSWTVCDGNLPDMPVRSAVFDPRSNNMAIIATEMGVWSTDNLNGSSTDWQPTNSGLANVKVSQLHYRASDRTLLAVTHGRGLFTATIPTTITPTSYSVTGGGSYCAGGTGVAVGLSGSETFFNYQLYRDTTAVGNVKTGTGSALSFGSQTEAGIYTVKAIYPATGAAHTMNGSAQISILTATPAVSITASINPVVSGKNVTFSASVVDGGSSPIYQWKKNGVAVGTNSASYTTNTLANNDAILCTVTSNAPCANPASASSNTITMVITPPLVVVTSSQGTDSAAYSNLSQAFDAINAGIHKDNIVVKIKGHTTEPAVPSALLKSAGPSSYTAITIKPVGDVVVNSAASPTASRAILELHGADNVTIDGDDANTPGNRNLSFVVAATTTSATAAISLGSKGTNGEDGCTNITIRNCSITGGRSSHTSTTSSYGIVFSNNAGTPSITVGSHGHSNILIEGNELNRSYHGINASGASSSYPNSFVSIRNNVFGSANSADNIGQKAIVLTNTAATASPASVKITGNDIRCGNYDATVGYSGSIAGIELGTSNAGALVSGNNIHDISQPVSTGWGAYGVQISSGTSNAAITITNNFIRDVFASNWSSSNTTSFQNYGIYVSAGASGLVINHNSILLSKPNVNGSVSASTSAGIQLNSSSTTVAQLLNNLVINRQNSTNAYCIMASSTNAFNSATINNNNFFSEFGAVGYYNSAQRLSLSDWQAATTKDANSISYNTLFVSPVDLHISGNAPSQLRSGGADTTVTGVGLDIDGNTRAATPDIGADEYSGTIAPFRFNITGGGSYCSGTPGAPIGIYGSERGISYQLYRDNQMAGASLQGTGTPVNFGMFTQQGVYKIKATSFTGLYSWMVDSTMVSVTHTAVPAVTIRSSDTSMVQGQLTRFTATIVNGGPDPGITWRKNGSIVATDTLRYEDSTLITGDVINCSITSNMPCASPTTATSNDIVVQVKQSQTITFASLPPQCRYAADFDGGATASSGLPVTYTSSNSAIATIVAGKIQLMGVGTTIITAKQTGNSVYAAAQPVQVALTVVRKLPQTLSFPPIPQKTFGDTAFQVTASSSTGLPLLYSSLNTDVAVVDSTSGWITIRRGGTVAIKAHQRGDGCYNEVYTTRALTIVPAQAVITFQPISNKRYGDAPFELTASSTSPYPIYFTSSNNNLLKISVSGKAVIRRPGVVTITAWQKTGSSYQAPSPVSQTFTIFKGIQSITFDSLPDRQVGTTFKPKATAPGGTVNFRSSNITIAEVRPGNNVLLKRTGIVTITAVQRGNDFYEPATATRTQRIVAGVPKQPGFASDITVTTERNNDINIYPNPAILLVTLGFKAENNGNCRIVVLNSAGKTVFSKNFDVVKGTNTATLNCSGWQQGSYYVQVIEGGKSRTGSFVKAE